MDDRSYRPVDRVAYAGMAGYSLINGTWVLAAFSGTGFRIFDSGFLVGIILPVCGLLASFIYQTLSRENRFSALANVLSFFVVGLWFLTIWGIIAAASAAV